MAAMRRLRVGLMLYAAIVVVGGLALPSTPAFAEKRVALVIGNDLYPNMPADRQLQKAVNDARTIGEALKSLGFDVALGTNLGRQGMIDKLADFTARLQPGDTAAFFFAGHGVAIGGVNYLIPSDVPPVSEGAEARVRGASLAEPDIIAEIQAKGVRVALLVIDACRDNPFPRAAGRSIGNTRGLADAKPARGIFTIYSAGIGQTALDRLTKNDAANNSVFTRVFADQLLRPGLHLGDLAVEVRERVAELALKATDDAGQPAPHEQTPAYYDQTLGGRIFLAGPSPADAVKAAVAEQRRADPCAAAEAHWRSAEAIGSSAALADHMSAFPNCAFAGLARVKMAALNAKQPEAERTARPQRPRSLGESCARHGAETYCVSSVLPPQLGNYYGVENLFNTSDGTAWVEGRPGAGIGEWVTVEFDGLRLVKSITVRNGYQKNTDIFQKNGRVRQVKLQFSQGQSVTLPLKDRSGSEVLALNEPVKAYWLKFTIDDVYPGSRYADTAISKLIVNSERAQ